ncbi:ATP-binding cassette domain-containing protein, partial [Citrobacter sp. AAK_AS5]
MRNWRHIRKPQVAEQASPAVQHLPDSTGSSHIIEVVGVNKSFGDVHVLKDITFYIRNNEFITLLGPSGCGKSTT